MKRILLLTLTLMGLVHYINAQNAAPSVSITSPTKYSIVYSNSSFTLSANAGDTDGSISKVEFYAGSKLLGTDTQVPYTLTVTKTDLPLPNWGWSDWSITVKAYDNSGNVTSVTTPSNVYVSMRPSSDAGLSSAGLSGRGSAARTLSPWVVLNKNGFLENITTATISYQLDNQPEEIFTWAGNVKDPNIGQLINIPAIANSNGLHRLTYKILSRNGQPSDEIAANDIYNYTFISNITNISVPVVSLTAPVASAYAATTILNNQTYTLKANAQDNDGGWVTKVDFFMDGQLIGSDDTAPFELVQSNLPTGTHKIVAKATDDLGGVGSSATATLIVKPSLDVAVASVIQPGYSASTANISPIVTIKNTGADLITSATITYTLDGGVAQTLNWTGSLAAGTTTNATLATYRNENGPHRFVVSVSNPNGGTDGDNANNSITRTYSSTVNNAAPTTRMLTPSYKSTAFEGTNFDISASAADRDGWITKVEFYVDNVLVGTDTEAPYAVSKNDISVGTHTVSTKAYDDRNGVGNSNVTTLIIAPALNVAISGMLAPSYSPTATQIQPIVTVKNVGNIEVTSATISYTLDGTTPKVYEWIGTLAPNTVVNVYLPVFRNENGAHTIVATISNPNGGTDGDASNNTLTRNFVSAVNNPLPTLRMLSPSYKSTSFSNNSFEIAASAFDRDGLITKVDFYVDDVYVGTDTEQPYSVFVNNIAVGSHTVYAKATDDRNGVGTSNTTTLVVVPALNVSLEAIGQPSTAPSATTVTPIVTLKNKGSINITSATVSYTLDGGTAQTVNWKGTLLPNTMISVSLPSFRNENGAHTIVATVSNPNNETDGDLSNNTMTRAFVSSVYNAAPTARMSTPSYKSTIKSNTTFTLSGTATDRDGWVTKVEFYLGSTLVGTDSEAPYAVTLSEWPVGTHLVTAKSYDDRNSSTISSATTLIVTAAPVTTPSGLVIAKNNDVASNLTVTKETTELNTNDETTITTEGVENKVKTVAKATMLVYPNPATDYTQLTTNIIEEGIYQISIINMAGKTVTDKQVNMLKGENTVSFELSNIPAGMYFVRMNHGNTLMTHKLVID